MEGEKFEHPFLDNLVGIPHGDQAAKKEEGKKVEEYMRYWGSEKEEGEIEKTPRDIEILQFAIDAASEVMKRYGREKDVGVSLDHIHIVPMGETEIVTGGRFKEATQSATLASFIIDRDPSDIQFCLAAFHEILHLKSYKALQIIPQEGGKRSLKTYRSGLSVVSRDVKEQYFVDLEEGVIELLVGRFVEEKIKSSELFSKELNGKDIPYTLGRQEEIEVLNNLVDRIFEKNTDQFSSREDVLDLFIRSQINGNLLPLGRLIEKTFGKGSFREIGEEKYPENTEHQ